MITFGFYTSNFHQNIDRHHKPSIDQTLLQKTSGPKEERGGSIYATKKTSKGHFKEHSPVIAFTKTTSAGS
jgi:hypothetical protein